MTQKMTQICNYINTSLFVSLHFLDQWAQACNKLWKLNKFVKEQHFISAGWVEDDEPFLYSQISPLISTTHERSHIQYTESLPTKLLQPIY